MKMTGHKTESVYRRYAIRRAGDRTFRGSHRPFKSINLQATEELVAVKAKRHLVVLLSQPNTVQEDIRQQVSKDRKIHERSFLGLPLYGRHRGEAEREFPNIVVDRIQALMYNQFFYFPPSSTESTRSSTSRSGASTGFNRFMLTRWRPEPCLFAFTRTPGRCSGSGSPGA